MKIRSFIAVFFFLGIAVSGCDDAVIPKPRGYFRIALPEKGFKTYDSVCPFAFRYPTAATLSQDAHPKAEPCWLNLNYPTLNATLHISYKKVNNNLREFLEDSRTLAMKHTLRANDIREEVIVNDSSDVYGLVYDIRGNAASSFQFYLTDSLDHFVRASLYFNAAPNADSVAPVLDHIKADMDSLIKSFRWKDSTLR